MARQKKRADGRLEKKITVNGKQYHIYRNNAQEIEQKAYDKRQEILAGKETHDNPTLDQYYERFTAARSGSIKEHTLHSQKSQYKVCSDVTIKTLGKRLGDIKLKEITVDDLREVQAALKETRRTQTVNDAIAHLSHVFNTALKERIIDYNPCCLVKPLKRTEERARDTHHRALTVEETGAFFAEAKDSYYYNVYRMAVLTGMRVGEIGALLPQDIKNGSIHINRTITRELSGCYVLGEDAKTESGKREIPLTDQIKEVIEDQKAINKILDGQNIIKMIDPIFKAPERGLLMSTPVNREIKRICKHAGVEYFTMHALRATFATRCIEQGINPRTVQELLGHSDYSITMNLYGHVLNATKKEAMQSLVIAL